MEGTRIPFSYGPQRPFPPLNVAVSIFNLLLFSGFISDINVDIRKKHINEKAHIKQRNQYRINAFSCCSCIFIFSCICIFVSVFFLVDCLTRQLNPDYFCLDFLFKCLFRCWNWKSDLLVSLINSWLEKFHVAQVQ